MKPVRDRVKKITSEYVEADVAMRRLVASLRKRDCGVNRRTEHQTIIKGMILMIRNMQNQFEKDNYQ